MSTMDPYADLSGGAPDPGAADPSAGADTGASDPAALMKQALALLDQVKQAESDEQDTLLLEKMTTMGQQYLADQVKLQDTATGAGPGARLVRKATANAGGSPGY